MTCRQGEQDDLAERYVLGQLGEREQEAFEDHYFDCPACLDRVRALQDAREELSAATGAARRRRWPRIVGGVAAAAAVGLAVRVGQEMWTEPLSPAGRPSPVDIVLPAPPPRITIELPPYTPPRLRAAPSEAQRVFRDAMAAYVAGNCAGAMPGLERALAIDASLTQARLYRAACELQTGRTSEAVEDLQRVIAAAESPYLEDAGFLLAQGRIQQGDRVGAREELRRVIALDGERRRQAERLLDQLR
jgi:tetratricopeptide (TPR) repeat protein